MNHTDIIKALSLTNAIIKKRGYSYESAHCVKQSYIFESMRERKNSH